MSPSPQSQHDSRSANNYRDSWRAIMRLVRTGTSWSGHERNCVFLNCTEPESQPRFTNASAVSGLDFDDDGRAMAIVDWDQDGDLDIWLRNRTAPRLRLMSNRTSEIQPHRNYVAVRLRGTTCNRDAIGARVELVCRGSTARRVQTVRAGDAFLSQSSKWLHFGLDEGAEPSKLIVHWPGGQSETFSKIATGGRYELKQASGTAKRFPTQDSTRLAETKLIPLEKTAAARIVLPGRIAFPQIQLTFDEESAPTKIELTEKPVLYTFWTSSCPNCRRELTEFAEQASEFADAELDLVAVCLDGLNAGQNRTAEANDFLREIEFPFRAAQTDSTSLALVRDFLDSLFGKTADFVVPLNILVDPRGEVISFYRGSFPSSVFIRDKQIMEKDDEARRTLATPFAGTWITKPATPTQFAEFVGKRLFEKAPEESLRYYEIAMNAEPNANRQVQLRKQIASTHLALAKQSIEDDPARADRHFQSALRLMPKSAAAHRDYGNYLQSQGKSEQATKHLQMATQLRP